MIEPIAAHFHRSGNGRYVWKINTICRRPHISGGKKGDTRDFGKLSKYHPKFEVAQHTSFSCWFYSSQRFSAILRPHILEHRAHTHTQTHTVRVGLHLKRNEIISNKTIFGEKVVAQAKWVFIWNETKCNVQSKKSYGLIWVILFRFEV